jgi:hypothetical protein
MTLKYNRRRSRRDLVSKTKRSKVFAVPMLGTAISVAKPLKSIGLGCHRTQVEEFNQFYRENGINSAHHDANGDCILESRQARNQVLKLRGMRDNDAGYGDHSGK